MSSEKDANRRRVEELARIVQGCDRDRSALREAFARARDWSQSAEEAEGEVSSWRGAGFLARLRAAFDRQAKVKQRFAAANLRLVVTIAKRHNRGGLPLADLIQEGNLGLMTAVERFDPDHGCRFSTYASWWIRHGISRAIADKARTVRIPVHHQDMSRRVARLTGRSLARTGSPPTIEALAQETGASKQLLKDIRDRPDPRCLSIDRRVGDAEGAAFVDLLGDESLVAPDEAMATDQLKQLLAGRLSELQPIEMHILRRRFGLDGGDECTLREVGEELSLSRERIRQLQNRAFKTLRQRLDPGEFVAPRVTSEDSASFRVDPESRPGSLEVTRHRDE
jgi:RNA polymerase primary sigma factor